MAFWGVEVKPGKPYTHSYDDSRGRLRITQATLGNGSGTKKKITVQCNVGNKKPVLLCSLFPDQTESRLLDLEFEESEEVVFSVIGPSSVHLTGYFVGYGGNRDDDETDSYGEDIAETSSDVSDSSDSDESFDDDFINDGPIEVFSSSPSPKPNTGVTIEEIVDDEKPGRISGPESEDEDGFPITIQRRNKNNRRNNDAAVKLNVTPDKAAQEKDTVVDGDITYGDHAEVVENKRKHSADSQKRDGTKKAVKPKNKKKDKIRKDTTSEPLVDSSTDKDVASENFNEDDKKGGALVNENQDNIVDREECRPDSNEASVENSGGKASKNNRKNKKRAKVDAANDDNEMRTEQSKDARNGADRSDAGGSKKKQKKAKNSDNLGENGSAQIKNGDTQPQQTRTFPNGYVVEELHMGKPDGKRASIGKKVSVNYIGKLKDGKIFDSNVGRQPFMFRLGVGQVIKGWDIGVEGMRVGDKRRLTIPPSLGYGDKKAGKLPPNSWLTFDVELVDVK